MRMVEDDEQQSQSKIEVDEYGSACSNEDKPMEKPKDF